METMETIEWRECTPRIRCTKFGGCNTKLHNTHLTCPDYSPVGGVVAFALQVARGAEAKVRAEYGATPEQVRALVVQSRGIKESHCFECRHWDTKAACETCAFNDLSRKLAPWEVR